MIESTAALLAPPPRPEGAPLESERVARASPGTGARVWLVRHGRVVAADVAYGDEDVTLSKEGIEQSDAVAGSLAEAPLQRVASSPLQRALVLGEKVAEAAGLDCRVDPRFAELHRGRWQGLPRVDYVERWAADAEAYWRDPMRWRGHGGETEEELVERAWPALIEVVESVDGGVAAVAAHRQVLRALVAAAIGVPPARSHALHLDPAHAFLLHDASSGWILERTNVARPGAPPATETDDGPPEDVVTQLR
ncbi:MAG: histidine phosphatase family protein [Planctomycetota bacterium]